MKDVSQDHELDTKHHFSPLGVYTAIATCLILAIVAYKLNAYPKVFNGLSLLLSGNVDEIKHNPHVALSAMVPVLLAVIVIKMFIAIPTVLAIEKILGSTSSPSTPGMFSNMTSGNHFYSFFVLVIVEELFARGLFLGLLPKIPLLSGTIAFYALFLLGNGIWAMFHIYNFDNRKDRNVLRVLPQFIGGVFLTFVFVRYGLFAAILAHFGYNMVIFAIYKVQKVSWATCLSILYEAVCAATAFVLMTKPVGDISVWFSSNPTFALPGWGYWDYFKAVMFICSCLAGIATLLAYDHTDVYTDADGNATPPLKSMVYAPFGILLMFGVYSVLGLVVPYAPTRMIIVSIVLLLVTRSSSSSAVARTFWVDVPTLFLVLCLIQAFGVWLSMVWVLMSAVIGLPSHFLSSKQSESYYAPKPPEERHILRGERLM